MADYPEDLENPLRRGELSLLGIGWREAAGPLWRRPYRDVHVWSGTDAAAARQRALDAAALLPSGCALGTWAAACLGGAVELDGRGPSGIEQQPVVLALPPRVRLRRDPSVRPLRSELDAEDICLLDGVPVTTPVRTAFDLARTSGLEDAVVCIDYLARGRPSFLDELGRYTDWRGRWKGVPTVRRALALASALSRSSGETRFRLLWSRDARLPAPQVNAVVSHREGHLLGMVDLLDERLGLVGEYDGAGHREATQHAADNAREEWLEHAGLVVVRVGASDLGPARGRTVARLQSAAARAGPGGRAGAPARARAGGHAGPGAWTWRPGPWPEPTPHW